VIKAVGCMRDVYSGTIAPFDVGF